MTVRTTGDSGDMVVEPPDPMTLLDRAVQQGATPDQLEKLLTLQERFEKEKSRRAYTLALAEFKRNPPTIVKNRNVGYAAKRSGTVDYKHATLAEVVSKITPVLAEHGLSHSWQTSQDGDTITVRCVLTHKDGHSESVELSASPDHTGSKNAIQAVGSTVTYLQRYCLLSITGLAAEDQDDDAGTGPPINRTQVEELWHLLQETRADEAKFLEFVGVGRA